MKLSRLHIRRKIWLAILLPTFLIALVTGMALYFRSRSIATKEARHRLKELTHRHKNMLESAIYQTELIGNMMHGLVSSTCRLDRVYGDKEAMQDYKEELATIADSLCQKMQPPSLWVVFNPELAPGAHTVSYYDRQGDGYYQRSKQYRVTEKNLQSRQMQWWTQAVKKGEHWTLRYYWEDWDMEIISYAKAIYCDSLLVGVAGSDFVFKRLRERISSAKVYQSGYLALLDSNYNLLIHPEHKGSNLKQIISKNHFRDFRNLADTSTQGIVSYKYSSGKQMLSYTKLNNNWILIAQAPYKEVYAGTVTLSWFFVGLVVLMIALAYGIASVLGKSLTRPIHRLITGLRNAQQGNLEQRVAVDGSREIRELTRHFNRFMQNITKLMEELQASEKQLQEARMKAEEAEKLKSAFLTNISHEFRTPLNAIQGLVEIISSKLPDNKENKEHTETIQEQIDYILSLLDNLLEMAKLKMNELKLHYRAFNLNALIRELHKSFNGTQSEVIFKVKPAFADANAWIISDEQRLKRVLEILLDNAFKFTHSGSVILSYQQTGQLLQFSVADTGIGIPSEQQPRIFNQFVQGNPNRDRAFGGTGIGLAIARQIVENMHGTIGLDSKEGQGSTFYFTIPFEKSHRQRLPRWLKQKLQA